MTEIGSYTLVEELGRGATSTTYRAVRDGDDYVLKLVHNHLVLDQVVRKRMIREVTTARELDSPHLCRIFDLLEEGEQFGIVTEFCPLGNISGLSGRPFRDIKSCILSLLDGLAFLHAHGIIHRNLKLENVLLSAEDEAKICDLVFARMQSLAGLTSTSTFQMNPAYVPPEYFMGIPPTPASDLYNVGIIIYELLSAGRYADSVRSGIRPDVSALPAGTPEWLREIIANLTGPRDERIQSAERVAVLIRQEGGRTEKNRKKCLFCGTSLEAGLTVCPACGKPEPEIRPYYENDAEFLVLKSMKEDRVTNERICDLIRGLAGDYSLNFQFITENIHLYSRHERKKSIRLPVVIAAHVSPVLADRIVGLVKPIRAVCVRRPMKKIKRYKRGPLILLHAGVLRIPEAERIMHEFVHRRRQESACERDMFSGTEMRIAETCFLFVREASRLGYGTHVLPGTIAVQKELLAELERIRTASAYLEKLHLSTVLGDIRRLETRIKDRSLPPERIQEFDRLLEERKKTLDDYFREEHELCRRTSILNGTIERLAAEIARLSRLSVQDESRLGEDLSTVIGDLQR